MNFLKLDNAWSSNLSLLKIQRQYKCAFSSYSFSKFWVGYSYLHWLILHVRVEYSCLLLSSLLLTHADMGLTHLIWTDLVPYWWSCVICLIHLPSVLMARVSWSLRDRPIWIIVLVTWISTVFRMIWTRTHNFRCWIQQYQRIKALHGPPSI